MQYTATLLGILFVVLAMISGASNIIFVSPKDIFHAQLATRHLLGAIGIALVGNFSEKNVSSAELEALTFLVKTLQQYYRIPNDAVIRHRDVPGKHTECPGNNFPWAEFKRRL